MYAHKTTISLLLDNYLTTAF